MLLSINILFQYHQSLIQVFSSINQIALSNTNNILFHIISGIDLFRLTLEKAVLDATGRKIITIKVPAGGKEMR